MLPALQRHPGAALARVRTVADFQRLARSRAPRAVYDYVDGSAEDGLSADRAVQAFRSVGLLPHVLRDVSAPNCSSSVLGRPVSMPMVIGPTGFTRMMHASGELAVARAASRHNLPYVLSTMGTTSIEELASSVPDVERWFQLYVWQDRDRSLALVEQAQAAGYSTLVVTVDVPVAGARHRDVYNGLTIPPSLTPRTLLNMATKPSWVFDSLTTRPLKFDVLGGDEPLATQINRVFDPSVTFADLEWLRSVWSGSLVVKGLLRGDDARRAVSAGVDGIAVSNHGGRQLDRALAPLHALPEVLQAAGPDVEVYVDGGVRSGADVAVAVALGARAVFLGRPYLYALMGAGEAGVDHLLTLFHNDYARTLQLLGVTSSTELGPDLISTHVSTHV